MKILFFFNGDFEEGNGANARFLCYGKGLNILDVSNIFFVIKPSEFGDSGINSKAKGQNQGVQFEYLSGKTKREKSSFKDFLNLLKAWYRSWQILINSKKEESVIYCYAPETFTHLPILLAAKLFGFKIIFEQTELHSLGSSKAKSLKKSFFLMSYWLVEELTAAFCDTIFLTTKRLQLYYRLKHKYLRIEKMPVVVDFERFSSLAAQNNTYRIGYLGSFAEKDGVSFLLKAFDMACKSNNKLSLRLIGFQGNNFSLSNELRQLNIENTQSIEATGQVLHQEIPKLLAECDLLVMPRINSTYANYGYPIKLAEYMATARPVIASNVSDISLDFLDGIEIKMVQPANVEELTHAILERYIRYQDYNRIGERGKLKAQMLFAHEQHAQKIANLAEQLLA